MSLICAAYTEFLTPIPADKIEATLRLRGVSYISQQHLNMMLSSNSTVEWHNR